MEISIADQTRALLLAGAAGIAAGVLYDVFRIIRRTFGSALLTAALDLLFWLAASVGALCFMLAVTGGRLRVFAALGSALGAVFYFLMLSEVVLRIGMAVMNILKKLLAYAVQPIGAILRLAGKTASELRKIFKKDCKLLRERCMIKKTDKAFLKEHRRDVGSGGRLRNEENEPGI
jgi:spore cortex biosynthesis protein YabQ